MSRLSLSTEGAHAWEIDAHVWLGSMTTKEPRGKTKWFEYDEERKEHSVIEEWILAITKNTTTITLPTEITWQPCPECVKWLLSTANHMLPWEGSNNINLMGQRITKIPTKKLYLTGESSWSSMSGQGRTLVTEHDDCPGYLAGSKVDEYFATAGSCSTPLESEGEDRGVLREQELAGVLKEMSSLDIPAPDDHVEGAFVMLEEAEVEVMVDERVSQDMDSSLSSTGRPQTTSTRRAVAPTIATRISELEGRAPAGSPGTRGARKESGRKKKKVLDLSNCQRIDQFITAMGGRKAKRKTVEDDQEEGQKVVKRMRGPPGT